MLDSGVKPHAVLIQLAPAELMVRGAAERQYATWASRFSRNDIHRLAPFTKDQTHFRRVWFTGRMTPWTTYRQAILSDLLPDWHTTRQRMEFEWENMDEYGFSPHAYKTIPPARRLELQEDVQRKHARALNAFVPGPMPEPVYRDLTERCRAEGIAVAFFWAPVSPTYQSWYTPASRAAIEGYHRWLGAEFRLPIFPAPDHLGDLDFADGYHLLRHGAAKYSRWLADNHIRPWLATHGLAK
jgi:hypothetical protein